MNSFKSCVTIIGGGNSTHTLIPLLSYAGHKVNLLTRKPLLWSKKIRMDYMSSEGDVLDSLTGVLDVVTDDPNEVIPYSDVVILSLPVAKQRVVLDKIAPFINPNKQVIIGTIYGQAGFNWMIEEIIIKYDLKEIAYFACGLIPWITRTSQYGIVGNNYGPKFNNVVALSENCNFEYLNSLILDDLCFNWFEKGRFFKSDNFFSLTMSVDNQIIHLSRLYGLYKVYGGKWLSKNVVPLFYKDYDDVSSELLAGLDLDYSKIRNRIVDMYPEKSFNYMLNYLDLERFSYNSCNENIKDSFRYSSTLSQISTPTVFINNEWVFDKDHRFFSDDFYYGLLIAKWIAEKLIIETPTLDEIIIWAQDVLDDTILFNGKLNDIIISEDNMFLYGVPSVYGFNNVDDLID